MSSLTAPLAALLLLSASALAAEPPARPSFRDFTGLCGHTVKFKPELYKPVCGWVRDYHPVKWDLGDDTATLPEWPFAKNRVSWEQVYGSWAKQGLKTSACLIFDDMDVNKAWKDRDADAGAYAGAFASKFGPGGQWPLVDTIEIGNEPGLYPDAEYKRLHVSMARAIRAANPKVRIATCNVEAGPSDRYWKSAELFRDIPDLYDILRIHRYAILDQWPVWRRTYPENPKVPFLSSIQHLLDWRDSHAPGKQVWVSEFGWDCSTKKPDPKGDWAKWVGSTDEEQARWLVRSFFLFARMGVDKAFVYFYNDEDKPQLHACSGLTRNYEPKPGFHAVAWMLKSLADHHFASVARESLEDGYVYRFEGGAGTGPIYAVWHATRAGTTWEIPAALGKPVRAERMPLAAGPSQPVELKPTAGGVSVELDEVPMLLWFAR